MARAGPELKGRMNCVHLCGLGVVWLHLVPQSEFVTETEMDSLEGKLQSSSCRFLHLPLTVLPPSQIGRNDGPLFIF